MQLILYTTVQTFTSWKWASNSVYVLWNSLSWPSCNEMKSWKVTELVWGEKPFKLNVNVKLEILSTYFTPCAAKRKKCACVICSYKTQSKHNPTDTHMGSERQKIRTHPSWKSPNSRRRIVLNLMKMRCVHKSVNHYTSASLWSLHYSNLQLTWNPHSNTFTLKLPLYLTILQ